MAQNSGAWQFETVSRGTVIQGCIDGMTLAGFEYGPDGRPVLAWREENRCGGRPRVFWTRQDAGQWGQTEFLSERRYQGGAQGDHDHQLALRKTDGNPFLIYADVGASNEVNTYQTDLGAHPAGGVSTYLENLVGPQNCAGVNYSPAFGPSDLTPQWAMGLSLCNGGGPVRLNGSNINPAVYNPRASLAIGADGTRHVLWNASSDVSYARFPANSTTPDLTTQLFNDINRFGGEVRIAVDGAGVLHAIVRGPDISADWDLGAMVYLRSADGGNTWSEREYVDPHDDPAIQNPWNGNSDLSFAVDADGVPAVSFWRWNAELYYARRDGPGGTWTQQLVTGLPIQNPVRANQLRFDPDGNPVIAFYDPAIRSLRLARPVPPGVVMPVDVAVTASATPGALPGGAATTITVIVTNNGATNLDRVVLTNRVPAGAMLVSASPAADADGQWTFPLTSGASTTVTIAAMAPFTEGAAADVATVSVAAADEHPEDNAAAAVLQVRSDQCYVPRGAGSGLLGWWPGDGSPANGVTGLPESMNVFGNLSYERAVVGSGFRFDGASAVHAYHDNDNYYYPGDGSFTIEAYIKTSSPGGTIASRYECRSFGCGPTAWFLSLDGSGHLAAWIRDRTDHDLNFQGGRVINDGVFHHVALVLDRASAEARLYVDGAVDAVAPFTLGAISDSNGPYTPVVIGAYLDYSGNNSSGFTGVIDEVAIHNRALSAAEISGVSAAPSLVACGGFTPTIGTDLAVSVQPAPASVAPGGNASFLISVTNTGSTDLSGVNVDNLLAGGATFVDAAPTPQSAIGNFQNFNVGSLAKGEQKWIAVRVMAPLVPGTMLSQAHHLVDGDQNTSNDEARAVVQVVPDACFVPPASLVGRWRADGDVTDAAGGPPGSLVGGVSFEVGRAGQAFRIHGNGSYVEVPDAPQLKPAQFTIAAWTLAPSFAQGGYDTVIAKGASGQDGAFGADLDSYWLGFSNGRPTLYTHHQSGTALTQGSTPLSPMQWYHLAATFDGATTRVFVNGLQVAETFVGSPLDYDSRNVPLVFGDDWQYGYANGADFGGLIDDVTIHARALSPAEVEGMFTGSPATCGVNHPPVALDDQVEVLYSFGETDIDVRANDSDPDGDILKIDAIVDPPEHGTATIASGWTIRYAFTPGVYAGSDRFSYRVSDGNGATAIATVSISTPAAETADLRITASGPVATDAGYQQVTITVTNAGPHVTAAGLWAQAPEGTFLSPTVTTAGFGCLSEEQSFTCMLGTLAPGEQRTVQTYVSGFLNRFDFLATFGAAAEQVDPDPSNNQVELQVAVPSWSTPIRNGDPESRPQFNGVGMILPSSTHGVCTGTLISPFIVLTAAQCLTDPSPDPVFEFSLGGDRTARVTGIRRHPAFSTVDGQDPAFDFALASLDRSAAASWTDIIPATLRADLLSPVVEVTAIGFGETSAGAGSGRRTSGTLLATGYAPSQGPNGNVQPQAFLVADPGSADQMFCPAGTGGPLFYEDQIVGVASFRLASCAGAGPGFYVNVRSVADWIQATAHELEDNHESTPAATTTTLSTSINPSASGQAVSFRATVATVGAVAASPAGDVSFVYVPTHTTLATIALVDGNAVFETSGLPEGTFSIQAIFTGNTSFGGSTATLSQVVDPAPSTPIRNGTPESRSPFNGVGMILPSATHMGCTATLIGPFTVLTAAQCLRDDSPNPVFEFSLGAGQTARVTDIRAHPLFSTVDGINLAFDVAVAVLDRAAVSSWTDINPATLRRDPIAPVVDGTAIGFGETSAGPGSGRRTSGTLQITGYVSGEDGNFNFLPDAFLEANPGTANQMFCRAGTGGPLFYEDQVVGVASFRYVATCAEEGPGYYVTLGRHADWIHATASELANHPPTTNIGDPITYAESPVFLRIAAFDDDHDVVQVSIDGLPPGLIGTPRPADSNFPYPSVDISGTTPAGSAGVYHGTVTMDDGTVTVNVPFTWTVRPPNHAPIAVDDAVTIPNVNYSNLQILANDSDPDGDAVRLTDWTPPLFGEVSLSGDASLNYHPRQPGHFTDTFTYTIEDSRGASSTATVTIRVLSPKADLAVTINPSSVASAPGQTANWTLTVTNQGAVPASNVRVTELLPSHLTFVAASVTPNSPYDLRFQLGDLAGGESRTITIDALPPAWPAMWHHTAEVSADDTDEPVADNTAAGVIDVEPAFCFVPALGLQGLWHFEGSTADQQNLWPGDAGVLSLAPSRIGQAFDFNGTLDSYVSLRGGGPRSSRFTLAAWTRRSAAGDADAPVISDRSLSLNGTAGPYWFGFRGGHPVLVLYHDAEQEPAATLLAPHAVPVDTWAHIAATYDGAVARLFVNGIEVAHQDVLLPASAGGRVLFGQGITNPIGFGLTSYGGLADDIAIYDRAVSAAEVQRMVLGDPVACAIPTTRSLSVALSASPSFVETTGLVAFAATITNTSDGYLEEVELEYSLEPMASLLDAQPPMMPVAPFSPPAPPRWGLGPLVAGESRTVTIRAYAPPVDGHFSNHARAYDAVTGAFIEGDQPFTVAPEMCFVAPSGVVAHWRGEPDDPATATLVPLNVPIGYVPGRVGQTFDGGNNNFTLPNQAVLTGPAFTIGSWVRVGQLPDHYWQEVVMTDSGKEPWPVTTQGARVFLGLVGTVPTLLTRHQDGTQYLTQTPAGSAFPLDTWHYLAASWDGLEARLYVDGVGVARQEIPSPLQVPEKDERLLLGFNLLGLIDETLIYDRALNRDEVRNLFEGSPDTCQINEPPTMIALGPQTSQVGEHPVIDLKGSGPEVGDTLTFSATGLPAGVALDPATGVISGELRPDGSGNHLVTVTVSDGRLSSVQAFDWTVLHQLGVNVAVGGSILINGDRLCDAMAAATVCTIDVAPGGGVDIQEVAKRDGVASGWFRAGNGYQSSGFVAVEHSAMLDYFWRVPFTVTATPISGSPVSVLSASVPIADAIDVTRPDYLLCPGISNACYGFAHFGSTVELFGSGTAGWVFDGFTGACEGTSCSFAADRTKLDVTAHYHVRPVPVTVDVAPGGSVHVSNDANANVFVCDGPATAPSTRCVTDVPYGSQVTITPVSLATTHWRWTPSAGQPAFTDDRNGTTIATNSITAGVSFWTNVHLTILDWLGPSVFSTLPIEASPPVNWTCQGSSAAGRTDCATSIPLGATYTLTPIAVDILFKGWTGDCAGSGACVLPTTQGDLDLAARFAVDLTVIVGAGGQAVRGTDRVCDGGTSGQTCVWEVPVGVPQTISAVSTIWPIWGGDADPGEFSSIGITLRTPKTVSLTFLGSFSARSTVTGGVITAVLPSPYATYDPSPGSMPPSSWSGRAPFGSTVQLTAQAPAAGYGFSGWTGDCSGLGPCALVITRASMLATATFSRTPTALPASVTTPSDTAIEITARGTDPEGDSLTAVLSAGNPIGGQVVRTGPMTFRFTPNPGFTGEAFFYFLVSDGYSVSGSAIAIIQVTLPAIVHIDVVERITISDAMAVSPAVMISVAEAIRVADSVAVSPAVMVDVVEPIHVVDTVATALANTPAGNNVTAPAAGPQGGPSPIAVTFSAVTQPGNTSYSTQQGAFAPPAGFRFGTPPITFDIATTASYTAPLRVCINDGTTTHVNPAAIRLFHYEGGLWVDRTVSVDTKTHTVCASVSSLSPFAIAEPEDLEGRMDGDGEVEAGGKDYRFDFRIAERHIGAERGRLDLIVVTPKHGKKKEIRDEFESTDIGAINFWNDPAFSPGRWNHPRPQADSVVFTGTGKWNGVRGYTFEARAADRGEPGRGRDQFAITIRNPQGTAIATVDAVLDAGNIQSERLRQENWR